MSLLDNLGNGRISLYQAMLRDPARAWRNLPRVAEGELVPASDRDRYTAAQGSIPPGAPIFDRTLRHFLWDFRRNPISIADYPGAVSAPPGMPIGRGPEALRDYLRAQGFAFAAYDYASEAGLSRKVFGSRGIDSVSTVWQRSQYRYALRVQGDLEGMRARWAPVFDDGAMVISPLRP